MDISRSRRLERRHSPYTARSRSRSTKARRSRRSSSGERRRSNFSPKPRDRKHSYADRIRDRSNSPPRRSPPNLRSFESVTNLSGRLKKPEIQPSVYSVVDHQVDAKRFASTANTANTNAPTITLNERFVRLTQAGTTVYNKRFPGRLWDMEHLPHLILTNNMQLPPATLFRQAKTISVVVERKFPPGRKRPVVDESQQSELRVPRRANEGVRPIFDRPEIKIYRTPAEESEISRRLLECISSGSLDSREHSGYRDQVVLGPGRFYGSRVDQSFPSSRSAHPLDPLETPRNPSYFMHDTRGDTDLTSRRNWRTRFANNAGYRRDFRDRSPGSPVRSNPIRYASPVDDNEDKWKHDKYDQLEQQPEEGLGANSRPGETVKPAPKPVPAPKPILWSTIGKEIVNGETKDPLPKRGNPRSSTDQLDHSLHATDEDMRIDAEPVLVETTDDS